MPRVELGSSRYEDDVLPVLLQRLNDDYLAIRVRMTIFLGQAIHRIEAYQEKDRDTGRYAKFLNHSLILTRHLRLVKAQRNKLVMIHKMEPHAGVEPASIEYKTIVMPLY